MLIRVKLYFAHRTRIGTAQFGLLSIVKEAILTHRTVILSITGWQPHGQCTCISNYLTMKRMKVENILLISQLVAIDSSHHSSQDAKE
jgi:hypothetical protein